MSGFLLVCLGAAIGQFFATLWPDLVTNSQTFAIVDTITATNTWRLLDDDETSGPTADQPA